MNRPGPLWILFARRTFSRLAYWLSALGYDLRDRSITNRIYLVYFCIFWLVWAIALFALLGGWIANVLNEIPFDTTPPHLVVTLTAYFLVTLGLVMFWRVSRLSPFVFSEEDAYLLGQTPISRRNVGLVWFLQEMIGAYIPWIAGTVIVSFALVDWGLTGEVTIFRLFEYLEASLRALLLLMPFLTGWQAAAWGFGAMRLHDWDEHAWFRPIFWGAVLLFLGSFLFPRAHSLLMAPLRLCLQAAFLEKVPIQEWLAGLGLSFFTLAAGLAFLTFQSKTILLSRAAQETNHVAALHLALSFGQRDLADTILLRRRLGTMHPPSRFLTHASGNALFWKDLQQSLRSIKPGDLASLVWVLGLSLGIFQAPNWALQMVFAGIWTISIGALTTRRLRNDLAHWWFLRLLPLRSENLLQQELALSYGIYTLVSLSALALGNLTVIFRLYAAVLIPILAANGALAGAHDILRRSKARILMSPSLAEENVPRQNIFGILQGLISVLIPLGIVTWFSTYSGQPVWGAAAFPIAVFITWLNWKLVLAAYHMIG